MEIISSGIVAVPAGVSATDIYVIQEGVLEVQNGGWAQDIGLAEGGQAIVSNGAILYICTVFSGGTAAVRNGGYAQDITVQNSGLYLVSSGGTAHQSLIQSGGTQIVYADVMAAGATVLDGGVLDASSGAYVRVPVVSQGGVLHVWNGALVDGARISGLVEVNSKATVNSAIVLDGGKLSMLTGGYAYEAKISSGGSLDISSGGRANYALVYDSGAVMVSAGASCLNAELNGGRITLAGAIDPADPETEAVPGGFASNTTVNSGGSLIVSSGATATKVKENGGYVQVIDGADVTFNPNTFSGLALNKESATVHAGTTATGTTVNSGGRFTVLSGGTATPTTVNPGGTLRVSSGGTANGIIENGGFVSAGEGASVTFAFNTISGLVLSRVLDSATVHSNTTAENTTINMGRLYIYSGGTTDNTTVNGGGGIYVYSGGTTDNTTVNGGGGIYVSSGGIANNTTISNGRMSVFSGGMANSTMVYENCDIYLSSGGIANNTTISNGRMSVSSDGTANSTIIDQEGLLRVFSGGLVVGIKVNFDGKMNLEGGMVNIATINNRGRVTAFDGILNSAMVNSGGNLVISSGAIATEIVENGGGVFIADGANVTFTPNTFSELVLSGRSATVHSGTTANNTTINYKGNLYVYSGGTAETTTANSGGSLHVSSDGIANDTNVNSGGYLYISSGGLASNATVNSQGRMLINADGTMTGELVFEDGARVSAEESAILDFDISGVTAETGARVNNLAIIQGTPVYTLTVSAEQAEGVYTLAEGAAEFNSTLTVQNTLGETLGTLAVGEKLVTEDTVYTLNLGTETAADALTLTVEQNDTTPPVITLDADTTTILKQTTLTAEVDDGSEIYFRISEFGVWKKYTGPIIASFNETYYFKATDKAGNEGTSQITFGNIDTTGILLSTLWTQRGVCPMGGNTTVCYDEYTPYDPSVTPDTHSLVGCVNVAVGQLIYYFIEKQGLDLALTLKDSDEYTSSHSTEEGDPIVIEIKSDGSTPGTLSFSAINEYLSDFKLDSAEHAAALLYACGVVHKSKYAAASTGASWKKSTFTRSGFKCVNTDGPYMGMGYYYWGYWDDDFKIHISDAGYEVLIENLEAGRSVGAAYHGHALVIDGYDRETDTFHINFGWGYNQATRWYTREGIFELQLYDFVYDLMVDYVETFTVTDARLYGTGTMLRAFEQASGMAGANTVVFDSSVAGKTVELENNIKVTDETTVNGFNMNVLVTSVFTDELPAYGVYSDKGGILTFHASGGSLIVSTSNEYHHAFDMSEALSGTVTADNTLIYAGKSSDGAGAAAVLEALQVARSGNTEVPENLLDSNSWSFYGSTGNDVFGLSDSSIAVGNVSLGGGDDTLSLTGHSRLYGTIDAGEGDDSITVDSTSSISGDLSGKSKLNFVLAERDDHALFTVKKSVSDLYSNATLSVDVTDAQIGTYSLISAASGATGIEDLQNMVFTVTGSGSTLGTLAAGETLSASGFDYTLKLADDVLSVAVSETGPAPGKAKWTYLMYFAADNDLDASALDDLISIQRANIDERIDVYVLVDRPEYPWDYEEGEIQSVNGTYRWDSLWTDTRVGKIKHDSGLTVTVDWESWGELDTGSAETLDRFVKWVQAESPAENYALVLWDHGEEFATLCYDFTTDPDLNACLTVSDVSEVVKKNGNIPLVIFNSCLNASDIATTQMAGSTDVMVAPESPSMSSGTTYAYRPFFSTITADMTAREMADVLVRNVNEAADMPYPSMLTAIDVTDTRLADSLKAFAEAVLASGNIEDQNVLIDAMLTAPQRRCLYKGGMVFQSDLKDMILQAKADSGYSGTSEGFRTALANVESVLDTVVLDNRSAPGDSGYSIGFANMIEVSEKYLGLGYTADKVDKIILNYLTTWYGSNPEWADLLHELAGTYLARNAGTRTAVFDVVDSPDLVDGKVVQVSELGCFSGRGEAIDGVTLDGDVYFGFIVTETDKSAGSILVVNDAGASVSVSLLAGDGSILVTGDNTIAFSDLSVGDYFLCLGSETKCDVAFSFDADWLTGVDRFDYAGSGSNEKHANGNATPDTASVLSTGYYSGLLTSMGDSDFYEFKNTGTDQVRIAVESLDGDCLHVRAFSPKGIPGTGAKYKEGVYSLTMSVGDRLFVEGDANLDKDQVNAYSITVIPYEETPVVLSNLTGTKDGALWEASEVDHLFCAEYSMDNFEHVLSVQTSGWGFDTPELPTGMYQWRVKVLADVDEEGNTIGEDGEWFAGNEIVSDNTPGAPKIVQSNADGNTDLFFAAPVGTWNSTYCAKHVGTPGGWTGTNELISAKGKGRIQNLFFGSADVSTLYLTDSENGDALFVDDVYTGSPEEIAENTARLFQISEIYAGAGDDIVDMTSQRFAYAGDLTGIHGGDGNDVIWANSGDNQLFGDAGDDRIVGSSGYDFIVGGIGNDRMHGGGGDDIFTFCENWGTDTVEQLADGSVLLWFASGSEENWDESTLTYTDGENSVTVSGVTSDQITLKFGNDWSMLYSEVALAGGFLEFSSRRIFEESDKGILA